jgi:dephospho-CoA kinase
MSKIKIIGLTGQTGAGKSTVSELFRARGLAVINCDRISHELSQTEQRFIADLALEFPSSFSTRTERQTASGWLLWCFPTRKSLRG